MIYCEELEIEIPKGWQISYLSKIATYLNGLAMQKYECETEEYLPVLKIKELNQGYTDINSGKVTLDIPKDYIVLDGDVIFSWSASLKVDIWSGGPCGLNQHLFKVTSNQYEKWFYYLATKYHLSEFIRIAEGNKTSMGHIKREHLDNAVVFIPNNKHFKKINKLIKPLVENIILNKKEKFELMKFQEILLSKLATIEG
jgi:type I restriction enzyme S subunit